MLSFKGGVHTHAPGNSMRNFSKVLSTSLLSLVALAGTACTEAKTSVFVRHVIAPQIEDGGCGYTPDPGGEFLAQGVMDVAFAQTYQAVFAVANQLVPRANQESLRPESNGVQFYEILVEVFQFDGSLINTFTVPATGFADPGGANNPGYGPVFGVIIDADTGARIANGEIAANQTLVSRVVIRGVTVGGIEVETAPYDYPIAVKNSGGACFEPADCMADLSEFCYLGQDFGFDCRDVERLTGQEATACF